MYDEFVELDFDAQRRALDAYHSDHFVEAIQLMHGHLESCVRTLIFCSGQKHNPADFIHAQHVSQEISLSQGVKCLYVLGGITKEQYDKAVLFNRTRNKLVHDLHTSKVFKKSIGIKKSLLDDAFFDANDLSNELILLTARS